MTGWTYDANGNVTAKPAFSGSYDVENLLAWGSGPGGEEVYGYGADNRRVYQSKLVNAGTGAVQELVTWWQGGKRAGRYELVWGGGGSTLAFRTMETNVWFGGKPLRLGAETNVVADRLGSVRRGSGKDYFPYGQENPSTTAGEREKYATYMHDGRTDLAYADQRYYATGAGRFMTADPAGDGLNWYAYTGGDPVNRGDPSGLTMAHCTVYSCEGGSGPLSGAFGEFLGLGGGGSGGSGSGGVPGLLGASYTPGANPALPSSIAADVGAFDTRVDTTTAVNLLNAGVPANSWAMGALAPSADWSSISIPTVQTNITYATPDGGRVTETGQWTVTNSSPSSTGWRPLIPVVDSFFVTAMVSPPPSWAPTLQWTQNTSTSPMSAAFQLTVLPSSLTLQFSSGLGYGPSGLGAGTYVATNASTSLASALSGPSSNWSAQASPWLGLTYTQSGCYCGTASGAAFAAYTVGSPSVSWSGTHTWTLLGGN